MPEPYQPMPAVLDRQIENEAQDAFGHRHFAQALQSLVEAEHHKPPFSIGLLGGWGTGKSSIKELYTRGLADGASDGTGKPSRRDRIKSITFNAWRFGGKDQDIKRALLRHVFMELGGDELALHDKLFRSVTQVETQWKGWREYAVQLWRAWSLPLPAFVGAMVLLFGLVWVGLAILPWSNPIVESTFILAISGAYSYLLKNLKPSKVDSYRSITKVSLPSASAEQYEEMLLEQLKVFKGPAPGILTKADPCERLVIFVDDLDRLSAEEMVLGLDAVRAFMEIPSEKLPCGLGLVFVISCDEAKVADALARGRGNPEQPGTVFTHMDARRYLDRIFQFRLEIPPAPRGDMRQFALKHLSSFADIVNDLNDLGTSPEQVIDRMIHVNVVDPRNALQIVNAFAQSWWLAKRREYEGSAGERPGGLHQGAVTNHPISLGALSAARVSFPDFYRDLQDDPQLLGRLTELLVHEGELSNQPVEARALLVKRYVIEDKEGKATIREGCRDLRQFLSSLVGLRWPDSLQSLLLLSEDPITRKFGAGTSTLYNMLVSGDTQGLIEQLSTRTDQIVLSEDQAQLLHELISDLHLETVSRRHNAMRVIANLLDHLPSRTVRLMLGKLCNELTASLDLRAMVGLDKIGSVVSLANAQEQRQIAAELVDDLLTTQHQIEFRLETMQTPSLDEAKAMVRKACEIALNVRERHGLPAPQERKLVEWLKVRDVTLGKGSYHFDFNTLEQWIGSHEEMLLVMLGADYASLIADEVEAGRSQAMALPIVSGRVDQLFASLASKGEESREELWKLVQRYLKLSLPEFQACALTTLEHSHQLASAQPLSTCLVSIVRNLIAHPEPVVDYERGFRWVLATASARFTDLTKDAKSSLADLCDNLSGGEAYQADAVALFEQIIQRESSLLAQVSTNWVEDFADDLSLDCCASLLRAYEGVPEEVQAKVIAYFDTGFTASTLPDRFGELYACAASNIPRKSWDSGQLHDHLDRSLSRLPSRVSRSVEDLEALMGGLSKIYLHGSPATIATCLRDTFSTAASYPAQHNQLHLSLAGTWPSTDVVQPGYVPDTIFAEAINVGRRSPNEAGRGLLRSLDSMLESGNVGHEREVELMELACLIWQTHPIEAQQFLMSKSRKLTPSQIAQLPAAISWESTEEVGWLKGAWEKAVPALDTSERTATTLLVLALRAVGSAKSPDQTLSLWISCLGVDGYQVLVQALLSSDATDDGRRRLWRQVASLKPAPAPDELINLSVRILPLATAPETAAAINNDLESICNRLGDQESRLATSKLLLATISGCSSVTTKTNLARLAFSLGTQAALSGVDESTLSEDDLQIIGDVFGKGRELTKLKTRFEKLPRA